MPTARGRIILGLLTLLSGPLSAQDQRNEQFYYPGSFNWQFLRHYPEGGRLFNAFDYGHAVLYEKLYTRPRDLKRELEERQFDYLTRDLLVRPPRFAVVEEAIEPAYAKLAWRAKLMFDWAHMLHRQIYDIYADPRLTRAQQDSLIERVTDYYLSNRRLAFAARPKSMALMDNQYYSQVFRRGYPKFNGLIWAYHWLQVGLYEPLIQGRSPAERKAGVQATIARFWSMVEEPPSRFPKVMPMTSAVAPRFSAAHPRAAVIFDNLHMTHDIISDILAADTVPPGRKREVIYAALDRMQDSTSDVMAMEEWRNMGEMMGGIAIMGGPATGILPAAPTMAPEAPMEMGGMDHGAGPGDSGKTVPAADERAAGEMPHLSRMGEGCDSLMDRMNALRRLLLADSLIRQRVQSDTVLRRMLTDSADGNPHSGHHPEAPVKATAPRPERAPSRPSPADTTSVPAAPHHHQE